MKRLRAAAAISVLTCLLCACASSGGARDETAEALDELLAGPHRSAENKARDRYRHPRETLLFFGIRPNLRVVEIWPGGGWYTEIIAPLVRERGLYIAANMPPDPQSRYVTDNLRQFSDKLAGNPALYGKAQTTSFGKGTSELAPAESVDLIVTFRNIHNWMPEAWADQAFAAMYRALRPGGVLGVVEHRGNANVPQDPAAKSGYVNEDYAIQLIEKAGFKLAAKSEINANPLDTKDYEQGVWTLPPSFRLGDRDREKYAAIGESDRFTLKFVKPSR
jgi:predicted methyltransferase